MKPSIDTLRRALKKSIEEKRRKQMAGMNKQSIIRETENGKEKWCSACEAYHPATNEFFYNDRSSKHGLTSSCKDSQKKGRGNGTPRKASLAAATPESAESHVLVLDFGGHKDILDKLRQAAEEDLRQIDMHAIWIIRRVLNLN